MSTTKKFVIGTLIAIAVVCATLGHLVSARFYVGSAVSLLFLGYIAIILAMNFWDRWRYGYVPHTRDYGYDEEPRRSPWPTRT